MAKEARTIVKKVPNAILYSDGTLRIDNVRFSYPHLAEPYRSAEDKEAGKKGKFGVVGLLPKSTHKAAKDLIKEFIQNLLKDNKTVCGMDKWFLRDGDAGDKEEALGHFTISTSESRRPAARDRSGAILEKEEVAEKFYGGCYGNMLIRPWYQDGVKYGKGYGKKVNCGLVGVQFVNDGESFGDGRIDDEGAFDELDDDAGDYDFGGGGEDDL